MSSEFLCVSAVLGNLSSHHMGWPHPTSLFPNQEASNTWFINRQVNQAYKNDELINHLQQKLLIWNMYLCIKHELFSAASTPTQPKGPLSIDQNTNAFHPQKAQQRIGNQQTPCKCSWPKQFVTLSFDWMAVFFLWFYTWKLKIWWMLICSGTESDIGFSHMRGIPKTNESTNCDELEGPLTPVPGSMHQGKDPMCWNCTFFFRKFWGRVPLSWTIPLEK